MKKYFKYFWYVLKHKWFVFLECRKSGIFWLGIIHDWSKFRPSEFIPYARHFYGQDRIGQVEKEKVEGYDKSRDVEDEDFNKAWLYHIHRNKHHWQYWVLIQDENEDMVLEMPLRYRNELLADWVGAGKAITGKDNIKEWYLKHADKFRFAPTTRDRIELIINLREDLDSHVEEG